MPAVDVRLVDVVKRFGEATAVDHIDLEVEDGEFFSLLGPSGCGKTTTLRMIGGFEEPTSGLIELRTTDPSTGQTSLKDVTWLPPYERDVNTVFQNYALFPHLTIEENVAFGLRRKKVKSGEVKTRVADMLKLVELPGFERRKPTQISGGQAQRVALARALINRPSVLLLDEPLGALDLKLRKQMQVELKRIQQEVGITFIYVTHDQEEAMTMSDRIAVMNRGRYEQLGDPESLYERPTTRFVAGFLGVSNLLPGTIDGAADGHALIRLADDTRVRVQRSGVDDGTAVEVGVRPEKIRLRDADATRRRPGHNTLLGTDPRRVVPRGQHLVHRRDARWRPADRLRAERRTRHPGRAVGPRRGGPPDLGARAHLRPPGDRAGRAGIHPPDRAAGPVPAETGA